LKSGKRCKHGSNLCTILKMGGSIALELSHGSGLQKRTPR
jgi:hypothetical protein